jgi:regulator of protease activity HflC (stomatin/prohibitin superfamily)
VPFFFKIVPEYQRVVRFTLGRYDQAPRGPGWVWMIPFVHRALVVDLREEVLTIEPQPCITKDNAAITVDMLVFMRVINAEDSVLRVQNYRLAARGMAITTLRAVVGDLPLDDVLSKREHINTVMQTHMDDVTGRWGVKVNAVEIKDIVPPNDIQQAMTRQMGAERTRRAVVTEADGAREAAILEAQGSQQALILNAEGTKQAAILEAEGRRQATILNAEGFGLALDRIFQSARGIDDKTMTLQYLDMMKALANGDATKWIIPMELTTLVSGFARTMAQAAATPPAASNGSPPSPSLPPAPPPSAPEPPPATPEAGP